MTNRPSGQRVGEWWEDTKVNPSFTFDAEGEGLKLEHEPTVHGESMVEQQKLMRLWLKIKTCCHVIRLRNEDFRPSKLKEGVGFVSSATTVTYRPPGSQLAPIAICYFRSWWSNDKIVLATPLLGARRLSRRGRRDV